MHCMEKAEGLLEKDGKPHCAPPQRVGPGTEHRGWGRPVPSLYYVLLPIVQKLLTVPYLAVTFNTSIGPSGYLMFWQNNTGPQASSTQHGSLGGSLRHVDRL